MGFRAKVVYKGLEKVKIVRIIKRIALTLYCILIKATVYIFILLGINPFKCQNKTENLIVSLTSYGIRLKKCTWLAVYSMFAQSLKPELVVLYLCDSYQDKKIPYTLRKLEKMGLKIEYTKDTKSYKKLIPALRQYPNKVIITIDDDIYYSKHLIENLYISHLQNKGAVCANAVRGIPLAENRLPMPYKCWNKNPTQSEILFAVGYGGILYPPNSMNLEYLQEENYMEICPTADDIWFFASRTKNNTPLVHAKSLKITYYPVNYLYERFHKQGGLTEQNVFEGKNDTQLLFALDYFKITLDRTSSNEKK